MALGPFAVVGLICSLHALSLSSKRRSRRPDQCPLARAPAPCSPHSPVDTAMPQPRSDSNVKFYIVPSRTSNGHGVIRVKAPHVTRKKNAAGSSTNYFVIFLFHFLCC
jgi:hypothetical protein